MAKYSLLKLLKAQKMAQDGIISASKSFKNASWLQLVEHCNGCGASGSLFRPPADIWGVWIGPACVSHDWDYTFGTTAFGKLKADWRLYKNIIKLLINGEIISKWKPLYFMKNRAWVYYRAVRRCGGKAYWKNKIDSPLNKN